MRPSIPRLKKIYIYKHPVHEKAKRSVKVYVAACQVPTCTIPKLKSKIEKGIMVSIGLLSYLNPFCIPNLTDKEKPMCMGKLCLNFHLKFNAFMAHPKLFNGPSFDSIFHVT